MGAESGRNPLVEYNWTVIMDFFSRAVKTVPQPLLRRVLFVLALVIFAISFTTNHQIWLCYLLLHINSVQCWIIHTLIRLRDRWHRFFHISFYALRFFAFLSFAAILLRRALVLIGHRFFPIPFTLLLKSIGVHCLLALTMSIMRKIVWSEHICCLHSFSSDARYWRITYSAS